MDNFTRFLHSSISNLSFSLLGFIIRIYLSKALRVFETFRIRILIRIVLTFRIRIRQSEVRIEDQDPHPDPYQNVTDPQHWQGGYGTTYHSCAPINLCMYPLCVFVQYGGYLRRRGKILPVHFLPKFADRGFPAHSALVVILLNYQLVNSVFSLLQEVSSRNKIFLFSQQYLY